MPIEFDELRTRIEHLLASHRETQAIDLLKDNLTEHQGNPDYWVLYSGCQLNSGDYAGAHSTAQAALALDPESILGLEFLALSLNYQRRRGEALEAIGHLVNLWPAYARGHYWYAMILVGSIQNKEERRLAQQAAEHALRLEPENPLFYQGAAIAAEIAGDNRSALNYLHEGLRIAPHDEGLLRAAGSIDNSQKITGDQSQVLRGLLAVDPTNESIHDDFAEVFVQKQGVYARRFLLFIPALAVIASLAGTLGAAQSMMGLIAVVICVGLFSAWNVSSFKTALKPLPSGYLGDIGGKHRLLRPAWYSYGASLVLGSLGAVLGCFGVLDALGAAILICASVAAGIGAMMIRKEMAGIPKDRTDKEAKRRYWLRLSGSLAEGFWKRVLLIVVLLLFFAACLPGHNRFSAVPIAAIAVELLSIAGGLLAALFALGLSNNAFAYGTVISSSAKNRGFALFRGNISGLYFIGLHTLLGLLAASLALNLLVTGPKAVDESKSTTVPNKLNEKEMNDLRNNLRSPAPVPSFEVPDFPTIKPVPLED